MSGQLIFYLFYFILSNTRLSNANNEAPDPTQRIAAFDLGLHCLHVSYLRAVRHKCVEVVICGNIRM